MLSTNDIAKELNVSPRTVRNWCKSGKLKALQLGRDYRITPEDFEEFKQKSSKNKGDI